MSSSKYSLSHARKSTTKILLIAALACMLACTSAIFATGAWQQNNVAYADASTQSQKIDVTLHKSGETSASARLTKPVYYSGDNVTINWRGAVSGSELIIPRAIRYNNKTINVATLINKNALSELNSDYYAKTGSTKTIVNFDTLKNYLVKNHSISLGKMTLSGDVTIEFVKVKPTYATLNTDTQKETTTASKAEYASLSSAQNNIGLGIQYLANSNNASDKVLNFATSSNDSNYVTYKVLHKQQTLDGQYKTAETQTLVGKSGNVSAASPLSFAGFNNGKVKQQNVKADGSTNIEVLYTRKAYNVTFDTNGRAADVNSAKVKYGDKIPAPMDLTSTGYKLVGWFWDADCTKAVNLDTTTMPDSNITLFAKWRPITYTVKYSKNEITDPYDVQEMIDDPNTDGDGSTQKFVYDQAQTLRKNTFEKAGYTFDGWTVQGDNDVTFEEGQEVKNLTTVDGDVVSVVPVWKQIEYDVKFTKGDDEAKGDDYTQTLTFDAQEWLDSNKFEPADGKKFAGWQVEGTNEYLTESDSKSLVYNLSEQEGDTITLTALWQDQTYLVNYNANGGEGTMDAQEIAAGATETLHDNAYTKPGYTFKEWNTLSNGQGTSYQAGQEVKDLTLSGVFDLYAIWTPNTYTIHYTSGADAATGSMKDQVVEISDTASLNRNEFALTGHHFAGWTFNGTGEFVDGENLENVLKGLSSSLDASAREITLSAKWEKNSYVLEYDANSSVATGSMASQQVVWGDSVKLSSNAFKYDGYEFAGWSRSRGGSVEFTDGQTIESSLTDDDNTTVTLYAVWKQISTDNNQNSQAAPSTNSSTTSKASYSTNGGTQAPQTQNVAQEQTNPVTSWFGSLVSSAASFVGGLFGWF